ncbi:energy-coupling factor transporter transmembrane component T [Glutamicibacter sp.]|uniref:energy-coupling factor transporter transmembrane component T family protein n=1 Tax=Glutamicibacter sp. TaxID=1931995 RepID=UPI0028BE1BF9|nr:energy-coupling factor transporter transmembrane component T [Glutamicibacter sp.]
MSLFQRLHPFTVLSVVIAAVAITTAIGNIWVSAAVIVLCLFAAAFAGKVLKLAALSAAIVLPAFVSQLLIHGLASTGSLKLTADGVYTATALGLRTAVLVIAGLLCALTIDRHQLVAAIDLSKAPPQLGYLVAASLFLLPQLAERQKIIGEAQALRHVHFRRGVLGWLQKARMRAVPLVLTSLEESSKRAPHLAARGFPANNRMSRLRTVPDSRTQRVIRISALVTAVIGPVLILIGLQFGASA